MITVNKQSQVPLYEQIVRQFERMVLIGDLVPGALIPSVRTLSLSLSVNPNTVQKAYAELETRGVAYAVPGLGRYVREDARAAVAKQYGQHLNHLETTVFELALAGVEEETVLALAKKAYARAQTYQKERGTP